MEDMKVIYEPAGKAREYSPLALNIYNGCSHKCKYCYLKNINSLLSGDKPVKRKDILKQIEAQLNKFIPKNQVLMSFVSDIYCEGADITRDVLNLLLKYQVPLAILTKNKSVVKDLDIFKKFDNIKIGMTLTFTNEDESKEWEPGASTPYERFKALEYLHKHGVKTFASLEPVIDAKQTLSIISKTNKYVDMYKVGKLNHYKGLDSNIDWHEFGLKAVSILKKYGKDFYIKKDLLQYIPDIELMPENTDADFWALKKQ